MEEWRDVKGYEGIYQVSSYGRVRNVERIAIGNYGSKHFIPCKIKALCIHNGYYTVQLKKDGKPKTFAVHRLVAMAFVEGYQPGLVVNHKDEDRTNNKPENLEWVTCGYNMWYGTAKERNSATRYKNKKCFKETIVDGVTYSSRAEAYKYSGKSKWYIDKQIKPARTS